MKSNAFEIKPLKIFLNGILHVEKWKNIPNYSNKYKISSFGRIKSVSRNILYKSKNKEITYKTKTMLLNQYDCNGYLKVDLYDKSVRQKFFVHTLVASCFIKKSNTKTEINHKNGNKKDNFYLNLEWCNSSENTVHAYKILKCKKRGSKLQYDGVVQEDLNGNIIKVWDKLSEIEKELKYNHSVISRCCRKITKSSYGYKWHYVY